MIPNETPKGQLKKYLIGDLGPARRHLQRIDQNILQPTPAVLREIRSSIETCIARIERDVKPIQEEPECQHCWELYGSKTCQHLSDYSDFVDFV